MIFRTDFHRFRVRYSPFVEALAHTGRFERPHLYCENAFAALTSADLSSKSSATCEGTDERGPTVGTSAWADGRSSTGSTSVMLQTRSRYIL